MSTPPMNRPPARQQRNKPSAAKARKVVALLFVAATVGMLYLTRDNPAGQAFSKSMPSFFSTLRTFFSGFSPAEIGIAILFVVGLLALAVLAPDRSPGSADPQRRTPRD
jgi:hypothetical protein